MILTLPTLLLPPNPRVKWSSPLTRGLVDYWPLNDGGGDLLNNLVRYYNTRLVNAAPWTSGPHGWCPSFNGTSSYALGTRNDFITVASPFSVSCLVNFRTQGGTLISNSLSTTNKFMLTCNSTENRVEVSINNGAYTAASASALQGVWHHVVAVWSSPVLSLWIDGALPPQGAVLLGSAGTIQLVFGARSNISTQFLLGELSNIAFFNRALAPSEISLLYHRPLAMIDDSIELWRLASRATVPPTILVQPTSQDVYEGDDVSFSVVVSGDGPLSYQWRLNGVAIAGATSSTLSLIGVLPSQVGSYSVVISNSGGSVESTVVGLTMSPTGDVDIPVANRPTGFRVEDRTRLVPVSNRSTQIPIRVSL